MRPSMTPRGSLLPVSTAASLDTEQSTVSAADLPAHMKRMIERLTWNIYRVVSVALFASHQLMFSFMLCAYIMKVK